MRALRTHRLGWLFLLAAAAPAAALEGVPPKPVDLTVTVGKGVVVDCPNGIVRVATSSPEVVDPVTASGREVLLHAKALGQATLFIWSKTGERSVYEVTVEPNLEPFRRMVRETFPDEKIDIRAARDSLALVGRASSQAVADRALALVAASVKGAVSNLSVAPPPVEKQIVLHVKFAELNRTAVEEFGVNLLSTGAFNTPGRITTGQFPSGTLPTLSGTIGKGVAGTPSQFSLSDMLNIFAFRPDLNLGVLIQDLQSRGLLQILAEPNLVATNGKEASFLAGGEFPIPVQQSGANAGAITVMFREYGIRLSFLPVVTSHDTIRLHVKPEVSTIDSANGVTVSGLTIPALSTRRIETDVELGAGQSFVIGGLHRRPGDRKSLAHARVGPYSDPGGLVQIAVHHPDQNGTGGCGHSRSRFTSSRPSPPAGYARALHGAAGYAERETGMIEIQSEALGEVTWEQRLLRNAARKTGFNPEYQELKFTLHRKLLDRINLDALASIDNDRIRAEVRQAVLTIVESEPTLLTAPEKQQISDEVLHEVFGLGPLEPLLQDTTISDILVNGERQVYVERKRSAGSSPTYASMTMATCCASSTRSCRRSAAVWMNRTLW